MDNRDLGSLIGLAIRSWVKSPCKQKGWKCESNDGSGQDQRLEPATLRYDSFVKAGAHARQKRGRHVGIRRDVKTSVDRGEEGLLLFECGAARGASIKVCAQFASWLEASGRSFDQRVFIIFTWHRNFSANCLRP